jgi:hypothetical protein
MRPQPSAPRTISAPIGANIASATTTDLSTASGVGVTITGTATITGFGTVQAGAMRHLTFSGAATLTHNATSLILPGAANIVTAAGDTALAQSLGGGNWRIRAYQRASGAPITSTFILKQSAAPAPTVEGDAQWDTDDDILLIGDGAAARTFVPFPSSVVAGDLFYATSAKALTRLPKGTARQSLLMNAGATAPAWATLPFSQSFESAQQTISAAGGLTLAHGLASAPKLYMGVLICVSAEAGYSINDEVLLPVGANVDGAGGVRGVTMTPDATNLNVRFASSGPLYILNKSTGAFVNITNASWRLVVRAWA